MTALRDRTGSWRKGGRKRSLREQSRWDRNLLHSLSRTRLPSWRQIRHLPEVLSKNDSLRLKIGAFLVFIGLAIFGTDFYYRYTVIAPAVGGQLTEGIVGTPRSLNPLLSPSNDVDADLVSLMYSGLFTIDGDGKIIPDLVLNYTVSDDQKSYALDIRKDVRWHDGKPLTVDDVIFTFSLLQDPAWKSPLASSFQEVSIERTDDDTLTFILDRPFAPFISKLRFGIMPRHIWKDITPQNALLSEHNLKPVGTGPMQFMSLKRDKRGFVLSYTVDRYPQYHRTPTFIEQMTFKFYPDYSVAIEALRKRQVDSLSFVPRDMRPQVREMAHALPISLEMPQYTAVFFNPNLNQALDDVDVRRALAMSIDKSRILFEVLDGEGHPLDLPPISGYSDSLTNSIPHDLVKAAESLDKAGWTLDEDTNLRTDEDDKTLSVTLTSVKQSEHLAVMRIIKEGWTSIGVDVTLQAIPASDIHRTVIRPREYEALLFGQLLEADPDPYPFWHSSQVSDPGLNLAQYSSSPADEAIESARNTSDPTVRQAEYRRFLEILASDIPAAFLYSPTYTYPVPNTMQGFTGKRITVPADRFASLSSWYLETKRAWSSE